MDTDDTQNVTPAKYHAGMGFPHLNSRTGACMCLMGCCQGPSGCRCRTGCSGVGHTGCGHATVKLDTQNAFQVA